ncbi:hypothetical protein GTY65_20345 [Streptomyces sp. SID8379]|uniref:hypothetical protein n=1 Tax=unclassified Streptomyces TaxID=2593676 RepID=UPI0003758229|nr:MULTISPECIES: hypothetical protein [unclassified Streptomyces]MYW66387.1 hypothetical protein [Streptomyces sp. SID8379]
MTGIGPVEPYEPDDATARPPTPAPDVLTAGTTNPRTLYERWRGLSPWHRHTVRALLGAGAATAALLLLRPPPATPTASPWPSQVTYLHYQGQRGDDRYRFLVRVEQGSPVTVSQLTLPFVEFATTTTPRLPLTVRAGSAERLTVRIRVRECTTPRRDIDLPHLDLVIRNERARQHHSYLFGGAFPHDLDQQLRAACTDFPATVPPPTRPAGLTRR